MNQTTSTPHGFGVGREPFFTSFTFVSSRRLGAALAASFALLAAPLDAATVNWTAPSSTNLAGAANWSGGSAPTLADEVVFTTVPQSSLTTGNTLNWGRLVWNSGGSATIRIAQNQSSNRVINLGGTADTTAALAAGGAAGDLIVIGSGVGSGRLTISNEVSEGGTGRLIVITQSNGNINVVDADTVFALTAEVRGDFALTKTGLGTLTLGYNGALGASRTFTVAEGVLNANHSQSLGAGHVLLSGGTLTINEGAVGSLSLATGKNFSLTHGTLQLTLSSSVSYDRINGQGSGVFSITGGTLDLGDSVADYGVSYSIFSGFASGSISGLTIVNYDPAYVPLLGADGVLSFTPVTIPEPSAYATLAGVLGLVLAALRRRRP